MQWETRTGRLVELGGKLFWDAGVPTALISAHGATTERSLDCHSPTYKSRWEKAGIFADSREALDSTSTRLNRQILLSVPKSCSNPKLVCMEMCSSPASIQAIQPSPWYWWYRLVLQGEGLRRGGGSSCSLLDEARISDCILLPSQPLAQVASWTEANFKEKWRVSDTFEKRAALLHLINEGE